MRSRLLVACLITVCLGGAPTLASDSPSTNFQVSSNELAMREISERIDLKRFVDQLPLMFSMILHAGMMQFKDAIPSGARIQMLTSLEEAFSADRMVEGVTRRMEATYEPTHGKAVLEFLRSPVYQRISALERKASEPNELAKMQLASKGRPPKSASTIDQMTATSEAIELHVDLILAFNYGFYEVMKAQVAADLRGKMDKQFKETMASRENLHQALSPTLKDAYIAMYAPASQADLSAYLAFYASPAGRWFNKLLAKSLVEEVRLASADMGHRFVKRLKNARDQSKDNGMEIEVNPGATPEPRPST